MPRASITVNKSENTDDVSIVKLNKFDNDSGVAFVDIYSKNGMCSSLFLFQLILLRGCLTMGEVALYLRLLILTD